MSSSVNPEAEASPDIRFLSLSDFVGAVDTIESDLMRLSMTKTFEYTLASCSQQR